MGVRALLTLAAAIVALVLAVPAAGSRPAAVGPTVHELVGQRLVVALHGTTASQSLLGRVRRGEVGGVILFGDNVTGGTQLRSLTTSLQAAAREGGRPNLLVAVDQEGGDIRRLLWVGPSAPAEALGRMTPSSVRHTARAVGAALRAAGVNVNLAPVADVPVRGSFMAAEQRTFSADPVRVGLIATAFAAGLADAGVAATVKHFPGIGRATASTDRAAVTIDADSAALAGDLVPFRRAIAAGAPIVMLSNATYLAYGDQPATWSGRIQALLRGELGFRGVTITDALEPGASARSRSSASVAVLAAQAGVDLILVTGSEAESAAVYRRLLARASSGSISPASLRRSYDRVLSLKRPLG
jgi:beta-N-acetylhexosaminidase